MLARFTSCPSCLICVLSYKTSPLVNNKIECEFARVGSPTNKGACWQEFKGYQTSTCGVAGKAVVSHPHLWPVECYAMKFMTSLVLLLSACCPILGLSNRQAGTQLGPGRKYTSVERLKMERLAAVHADRLRFAAARHPVSLKTGY